jgi:hypothetical protein
MKLGTAAFLLVTNSGVSVNQCTDKCNNTFSRSITQILSSCVEACEAGGQVCDDFCEQYVSDTEQCKTIFCQGQGQKVEKKTNLSAGAGTESPLDQDADLSILDSSDVSFVADSVGVNNDDDACFNDCLRSGSGGIYDHIICAFKCRYYSQDSKVVSFVADSVGVNNDDEACFDNCLRSGNGDFNDHFICAFKCHYSQDGKDENRISLISNKVDIKEEEFVPFQCVVRECLRGGRYDRECVARCYGFPSYCHYECFDETNSDASYRECAAGCGRLESFAKKM